MTEAASSHPKVNIDDLQRRIADLEAELAVVKVALAVEDSRPANAEAAVRKHEDGLASLLEAGGIATFAWCPGHRSEWSHTLEALYGFPPGGYDGTYEAWLDRLHPDDRAHAADQVALAFQTGRCLVALRTIWPDGSVHWLQIRGRVESDGAGVAARLVGVTIDLTELKRSEEALQRSGERFAGAFRSSPDAMAITRLADRCLLEVNERWTSLFGYSRDQVVGRGPGELGIAPSEVDRQRIWAALEDDGSVRDFELDIPTRTGECRRAVLALEPVVLGGEPCVIAIIRDVTDQRRAQAQLEEQRRQLAHLNRVATVGALSSTVAHELYQPLAAILANAEAAALLLSRDVVETTELRAIVRDIANADRRANAVITGMRAMIQRQHIPPTDIDVDQVVADVLEFARRDLAMRNVTVEVRFDDSRPTVRADRTQLQQVLLNLILNACDAMADATASARRLTIACTSPDRRTVQISVTDTGHGIAPDWMARLYEPFFTSKEYGLGLGLAISRTIVDAHGGRLWAENNPGGGAAFHVTLPRVSVVDAAPAVLPTRRHDDAATRRRR